jgi:serine phosphatase RsbU (regulator of sigma subunit)
MLRTLKEFTGDAPQMDDITMVALEKRLLAP